MKVIQRYVFRRLLNGFLLAFPAFTMVIWLSQVLRQLNLVTDRGQGIAVFLEASILLLPGVMLMIGPITMLFVVIAALNGLNNDSELVSIQAGGGSKAVLLKPVLALAIPVTLLSAISSLYLSPASAVASSSLIAEVNASVIGALIRPGQFRSLGDDVVIQISEIHNDGTLEGIFVFDSRDSDETVAFLAGSARLLDNEDGQFLVLQDGIYQRRETGSTQVSIIEFDSRAIDLASLANEDGEDGTPAGQRSVAYLLNPDPNDPEYQRNPYKFTAELHNRLINPLYVLVLSLVPLAILGNVRTARQSRVRPTVATIVIGTVAMGALIYLSGALPNGPLMLPIAYAVPLAGIAIPILFILTGIGRRRVSIRHRLGRRKRYAPAGP